MPISEVGQISQKNSPQNMVAAEMKQLPKNAADQKKQTEAFDQYMAEKAGGGTKKNPAKENKISGLDPAKGKTALSQMIDQNIEDKFNAFMKMFLATIQKPNPDNPPDAMAMSQQIMTFIQATEQSKTNHLLGVMNKDKMMEVNLKAKSYLNKEIEYDSYQINFTGEPEKVSFTMPKGVTEAMLSIISPQGQVVGSYRIDPKSGDKTVIWDGKNEHGAKMDDGIYGLRLEVIDATNKNFFVPTRVSGVISEYVPSGKNNDEFTYFVKGLPINLSDIKKVRGEDNVAIFNNQRDALNEQIKELKSMNEMLRNLLTEKEKGE